MPLKDGQRIGFDLTQEEYMELKMHCAKNRLTISGLIRKLILKYLKTFYK